MGYKKVLAAFYRGVLSSRYRVRLEGTGILAERRATLFLPNHQASVDHCKSFVPSCCVTWMCPRW